MEVGKYVYIKYQGHDLWHERLLLARVGSVGAKWIILTPDRDMYLEDFGAQNDDVEGLRLPLPASGRPPGVPDAETYNFRQKPDGPELAELRGSGNLLAVGEALRLEDGGGGTDPWYLVEDSGARKKGTKVTPTVHSLQQSRRGVFIEVAADGSMEVALMEQVAQKDLADFKRKYNIDDSGDTDARVLAIRRVGDDRYREFKEAVNLTAQVSFPEWKLAGPRTMSWCLRFLARRGGPMAHHEWWRSVRGLSLQDYGVSEHEAAMRCLQSALEFDQLDAPNLQCLEHVVRRAQLVEHYHKERLRGEAASSTARGSLDPEEEQVFLGTHAEEGSLMVAPELVSYVSRELERQSAIDKQARKAREERALRRK